MCGILCVPRQPRTCMIRSLGILQPPATNSQALQSPHDSPHGVCNPSRVRTRKWHLEQAGRQRTMVVMRFGCPPYSLLLMMRAPG